MGAAPHVAVSRSRTDPTAVGADVARATMQMVRGVSTRMLTGRAGAAEIERSSSRRSARLGAGMRPAT